MMCACLYLQWFMVKLHMSAMLVQDHKLRVADRMCIRHVGFSAAKENGYFASDPAFNLGYNGKDERSEAQAVLFICPKGFMLLCSCLLAHFRYAPCELMLLPSVTTKDSFALRASSVMLSCHKFRWSSISVATWKPLGSLPDSKEQTRNLKETSSDMLNTRPNVIDRPEEFP